MTDWDGPRSPFAGMADLSPRMPVRVLSTTEIEQMLTLHQLYRSIHICGGVREAASAHSSEPRLGRDIMRRKRGNLRG